MARCLGCLGYLGVSRAKAGWRKDYRKSRQLGELGYLGVSRVSMVMERQRARKDKRGTDKQPRKKKAPHKGGQTQKLRGRRPHHSPRRRPPKVPQSTPHTRLQIRHRLHTRQRRNNPQRSTTPKMPRNPLPHTTTNRHKRKSSPRRICNNSTIEFHEKTHSLRFDARIIPQKQCVVKPDPVATRKDNKGQTSTPPHPVDKAPQPVDNVDTIAVGTVNIPPRTGQRRARRQSKQMRTLPNR